MELTYHKVSLCQALGNPAGAGFAMLLGRLVAGVEPAGIRLFDGLFDLLMLLAVNGFLPLPINPEIRHRHRYFDGEDPAHTVIQCLAVNYVSESHVVHKQIGGVPTTRHLWPAAGTQTLYSSGTP